MLLFSWEPRHIYSFPLSYFWMLRDMYPIDDQINVILPFSSEICKMWGVDIFHSSSFYIVAKLLPKMLKVKKFCVSLSSVIRNSLNNYVFPFHCTLGVKGSAVILACQGEPF